MKRRLFNVLMSVRGGEGATEAGALEAPLRFRAAEHPEMYNMIASDGYKTE